MFNEDNTETKKEIHLPFMITFECQISLKLQKITQHQKKANRRPRLINIKAIEKKWQWKSGSEGIRSVSEDIFTGESYFRRSFRRDSYKSVSPIFRIKKRLSKGSLFQF